MPQSSNFGHPREGLKALIGLAIFSLAFWGCGGGEPAGPTGTLRGKVTYNGNPVPEGTTIQFYQAAKGLGVSGRVGADGTYVARTVEGQQIPVGTYAVSVSLPSGPELSPEEMMKRSKEGNLPESDTGGLPEKYLQAKTSGVTVEVKEGDNEFNLDMTD